jgi:DNA repair protein RadD
LIVQGYLCPLVTKAGKVKADTSGLHVRAGEFVPGEVEALMDDAELVRAACAEVVEATHERNACLIFASGIKHGEHIVSVLKAKHDIDCGFVTGDTPTDERDATLARFKAGKLKYLCNVNVLTTGFDAPHIDCVALLRPTLSPGLYYQMVACGFRLHPSKANCLVLDFGGNRPPTTCPRQSPGHAATTSRWPTPTSGPHRRRWFARSGVIRSTTWSLQPLGPPGSEA